ncbi:B12-binding domain-containing radical SAM protein [Chloroflexota bacterium]
MNILFVWPFYIDEEIPFGLAYLSAMVKQKGHKTELFCLSSFPRRWQGQRACTPEIRARFQEKLMTFSPDLVGFSVISTGLDMSLELARLVKEQGDIPVIFGGGHPTVDPEGTINQEGVDMVCVGEGEHAFLELVTSLEQGEDLTKIANIWVKDRAQIYQNHPRPLIADLDTLPFLDRDLFDIGLFRHPSRGANFITGRGCPYKCSYCDNAHRQALYRGKGRFVRYRSISQVIEEVKQVVKQNSPQWVIFSDETFTLNKSRTLELCKVYREEIGLPFVCQTRPDRIDEEIASVLKEAGCWYITIGIEAGNDYIRNSILNRKMDRGTITKAFYLLKQAGVRTGSFNMIGMPGETKQTIRDTINLNREIRPDTVNCTVLMPLKGTEIRKVYERDKLLLGEPYGDTYTVAIIRLPKLSPEKLIGYCSTFNFYVYSSRRLFPFIHLLRFLTSRAGEKRKWNNLHWRLLTLWAHKIAGKILNRTAYRWKQESA